MVSLRARALNLGLRAVFKRRMRQIHCADYSTVEQSRRRLAATRAWLPRIPRDVAIRSTNQDGIAGEWITAPGIERGRVVLFFHGGAYAVGSVAHYRDFAWRLSAAARAAVFTVEYRLAPEHPFPAALEDATAAWNWLLNRGFEAKNMVIGGDSAGGGLTLAALLALRDSGAVLPAAALCISPWTDLSASGESLSFNAGTDPFIVAEVLPIVARAYLGETDPRNPLVSPLFGDPTNLPPLAIHVGSTEVLLSDSTRFADKAQAAGVDVSLKVWHAMPHIFHLCAFYLPEGRNVIQECGQFIREHLQG